MKSLTFNGIKKSWLYLLQGRYKPPFAPIQRDLIYVTGMDGAYLGNTNLRPLYINQPVGFVVKNDEHALQLKDELADWLITNEPVPLQFDDEPGRTYYAIVQNTIEDFERFVNLRQGTIQFLCLDPYSYGEEQTIEFQSDSDSVMIENKGTAETEPIFELEVKQPTTFAMVSNGDEYMMVGKPMDVEEIPFEPMTTILRDRMETTNGWTQGISVDGRIVTGDMQSNGEYFYANSFGTGLEGQYHGPALRKSLSETLQDFRAEALVRFSNNVGEVGRLEFHLLDASNNLVGRFGLYDNSPSRPLTRFSARAGDSSQGQQITDVEADHWQNWTNFFGLIRIERRGNQWRAYATLIDPITWRYHTSHLSPILTTNYGNAEIAQIQIHMMTYTAPWGTYEPVYMRVEDLWVRRINHQEGVPYIANEGDIITFDHKTGDAYINGEPVPFDFGADFFKLKKGVNNIAVLPEGAFDTRVKYRERYK